MWVVQAENTEFTEGTCMFHLYEKEKKYMEDTEMNSPLFLHMASVGLSSPVSQGSK